MENGALGKKKSGEWGKSRKDKTERATGLGRRTKEEVDIGKWDQTESPEIPDKGETEIPSLTVPS